MADAQTIERSTAAADLIAQIADAIELQKLSMFRPYDWQIEFMFAGADYQERMLVAANRVGKTLTAAAEISFHLTGEYPEPGQIFYGEHHPLVKLGLKKATDDVFPEGWKGKRFNHPVLVWTGSPTNETSRDIIQAELLGADIEENLGTGWIPKARLVGRPTPRQAGVRDVVEKFRVRHKSGGISVCMLKTYEQGWKKWQGTKPHVVWLDEEPDDYNIFSEAQTRTLSTRGIVLVTFTPLSGVTELVEHFQTGGDGIYMKNATWDDAPHLGEADKARLRSSYRIHERDARTKGIPMLGEGAVFPVQDEDIVVNPFQIPDHWARIKGCDFGIDHPAAGVELAWDRDADVIYVIDSYAKANELAPYHAAWFNKNPSLKRIVPVAWPHDGMNREKGGGVRLAVAYRNHGVNMLGKTARYPKAKGEKQEKAGPQPVEPIIDEVFERMVTGRFKVFSNQQGWLDEKRSYHRKDGLIVNRRDDRLKATFYALMMKRYAVAPATYRAGNTARSSVPIATSRVA